MRQEVSRGRISPSMADGRRSSLGVGGDWERVQLRKRHVSASLIPSPCACSPWPRVVLTTTLIPVLVTGIQSREVFRVERLFRVADTTLLGSCDKHRNEESWACVATETLGGRCGGKIRTTLSAERLPSASQPKISPSTSTALRSRLARSKRCGRRRPPPFPSFLCSSQESSHAKSFAWEKPSSVADATLLDSCDEHRNEESCAGVAAETSGVASRQRL